jgi:hypothetical protein
VPGGALPCPAITRAWKRTDFSRSDQPRPNVGRVGRRFRNERRASQRASMTTPAGFDVAAAMVAGPMRPSWPR